MRITLLLLVLLTVVKVSFTQLGVYEVSVEGSRRGRYYDSSPGPPCVLPFTSELNQFDHCTCRLESGSCYPWCGTTRNYDQDKEWARCSMAIAPGKNTLATSGGGGRNIPCVTPYTIIFRDGSRQTYVNCTSLGNPTNKPWCPLQSTYRWGSRDGWARCQRCPVIYTGPPNNPRMRGEVNEGRQCVFPSQYRGRNIGGCVTTNYDGKPWCPTTDNYDRDKEWGSCVITTVKARTAGDCANVCFSGPAVNVLSYGGEGTGNVDTTASECEAACCRNNACIGYDYDKNPGKNPRCYIHTNRNNFRNKVTQDVQGVEQYTRRRFCPDRNPGGSNRPGGGQYETETGRPITTVGGRALPGSNCRRTYNYDGLVHSGCTCENWYTPWCGTEDGTWGDCFNVLTE